MMARFIPPTVAQDAIKRLIGLRQTGRTSGMGTYANIFQEALGECNDVLGDHPLSDFFVLTMFYQSLGSSELHKDLLQREPATLSEACLLAVQLSATGAYQQDRKFKEASFNSHDAVKAERVERLQRFGGQVEAFFNRVTADELGITEAQLQERRDSGACLNCGSLEHHIAMCPDRVRQQPYLTRKQQNGRRLRSDSRSSDRRAGGRGDRHVRIAQHEASEAATTDTEAASGLDPETSASSSELSE